MISLAFVFPAVAVAALVSACWFLLRSSDAYKAGQTARKAGVPLDANPHRRPDYRFADWADGWFSVAFTEDRK